MQELIYNPINKPQPLLSEWRESWFIDELAAYRESAIRQADWVERYLAYTIYGNRYSADQIKVGGTHVSKSVMLPVYQFEVGYVMIQVRHNFYDWCVRVYNHPVPFDLPDWICTNFGTGHYEGMLDTECIQFCVGSREVLYMTMTYMMNECLKSG